MSTLPKLVSIDVIRDELEIYTRAVLAGLMFWPSSPSDKPC